MSKEQFTTTFDVVIDGEVATIDPHSSDDPLSGIVIGAIRHKRRELKKLEKSITTRRGRKRAIREAGYIRTALKLKINGIEDDLRALQGKDVAFINSIRGENGDILGIKIEKPGEIYIRQQEV